MLAKRNERPFYAQLSAGINRQKIQDNRRKIRVHNRKQRT
jgi:hypothetical protein